MAGRFCRFSVSSLVRAGLLTGVIDGLFSSILSVAAYGSTVARLFQGVASVPLGRAALEGGTPTAALGLLIHFCVAFGWSAVFLFLVRSAWIRRILASRYGVAQGRRGVRTLDMDGDVTGVDSARRASASDPQRALVDPVRRTLPVRRIADRLVDQPSRRSRWRIGPGFYCWRRAAIIAGSGRSAAW
jgi:hypothetical protein